MCNLSQKIKETGIEMGKKEMIVKMHSKGYMIAQIADVAGMEEKQIEEIIKNKPDSFHVVSGDDAITYPLMTLGAVGVISVIGNAFPAEF